MSGYHQMFLRADECYLDFLQRPTLKKQDKLYQSLIMNRANHDPVFNIGMHLCVHIISLLITILVLIPKSKNKNRFQI